VLRRNWIPIAFLLHGIQLVPSADRNEFRHAFLSGRQLGKMAGVIRWVQWTPRRPCSVAPERPLLRLCGGAPGHPGVPVGAFSSRRPQWKPNQFQSRQLGRWRYHHSHRLRGQKFHLAPELIPAFGFLSSLTARSLWRRRSRWFNPRRGKFDSKTFERLLSFLLPVGAPESLRRNNVPTARFFVASGLLFDRAKFPRHHRVARPLVKFGEFRGSVRAVFLPYGCVLESVANLPCRNIVAPMPTKANKVKFKRGYLSEGVA